MFLKLLPFIAIIHTFIHLVVSEDKPIIAFNIYERDDSFGQYFAHLSVPSLQIRAEANLTLNASNPLVDNYNIAVKVDEPISFDVTGDMNVSIDMQTKAKVFDISLKSNTFPHIHTRSRTSMATTKEEQTVISTNVTLEDRLNNMSLNYKLTLIRGNTCPTITLFHNLTAIPQQLLYFSSNVTEICDLEHNWSEMSVNISLESFVWHLANAELKQIFNFGKNDGSETMNATHPLMDVSVVANWDRTAKLMHFKKAIFSSKAKHFIPSFEIEFKKYRDLPNQLLISIFKEVPKIFNNNNNNIEPKDEL